MDLLEEKLNEVISLNSKESAQVKYSILLLK